MSQFVPVALDFDRNKKTVHLKVLLQDPQADCWPQRLWRWVAQEFPKGRPNLALVEKAIEWTGEPGRLLQALKDADFICAKSGKIRNWAKRAPFFAAKAEAERNARNEESRPRNENVLTNSERQQRWRNAHGKGPKLAIVPDEKRITGFGHDVTNVTQVTSPVTQVTSPVTPLRGSVLTPACAGASNLNLKPELEQHACMQQPTLPGIQPPATAPADPPPAPPEKPKRTRTTRAKPPAEYTEADYALIRSFREDWEDTLHKPGRMRGKPITDRELKAARGFRLESWTEDQLLAHKKLFLHDGPRPPRWPGDREWCGWRRKVLSVHDWFRFRDELEKQVAGGDLDREDEE